MREKNYRAKYIKTCIKMFTVLKFELCIFKKKVTLVGRDLDYVEFIARKSLVLCQ